MHLIETREFRDVHLPRLAAEARLAHLNGLGRGALLVYPPAEPDGEWRTVYAQQQALESGPPEEMRSAAQADLLRSVRTYKPDHQAVLCVHGDGPDDTRVVCVAGLPE